MSSIKVKKFCDNYRRDSFSDRVCDDLSEVILQFLPLKDKFGLECVSKQFQRTIFEKERELVIDTILLFLSNQKKSMNCLVYNKISLLLLENIVKKLPNIRCLRQKSVDFSQNGVLLKDRDIDLITKYCRLLNSIHCDFKQISNPRIFSEKLTKVVSFSADINSFEIIRHSLPNLQELNCRSHYYSCPLTIPLISGLRIKNLKKFSIELKDNIRDNLIDFQEFIENNRTLTHLSLDLTIREEDVSEIVFKQISSLDHLIELKIRSCYNVADLWLINGLKKLSLKCPKLKSLSLSWLFIDEITEITIIFNELQKFKLLKRLSIEMFGITSDNFRGIELILNNSIKSLKHLKDLRISFPKLHIIDEILFKEFDKHLPKLQNIYIKDNIEATEETANILSRLSKLESLDIKVTDQKIAGIIEDKVLNKCKQIKTINIWT